MQTATNPQTGERLYLSEQGWKPLVTATNPETGAKLWLKDGAWEPFEAPANEAKAPRELFPAAPEGMQDTATGPQPVRSTTRETPEWIMQAMDAPPEPEGKPTSAADLGKRFMRGLTEVPAAMAEGTAISARNMDVRLADQAVEEMPERAQMIADMEARLADPSLRPEERAFIERNLADLVAGQQELDRRATADVAPPEDRAAFQKGEQLRAWAAETFGVPEDDPSFMGALAEGAGSMVSFVTLALAGGLIGGGAGMAAATAGAGSALSQSQVYREARAAGLSEEEAVAASRWGQLLGTTEAIPISRALQVLPPRLRGEVSGQLVKRLAALAQAGGEEAAQEAIDGIGKNLIAQGYYDPERGTFEGVGEQALVGAILGAGVGALGQATQAGGGQAPTAPGSGGLPGGEATGAPPPRPRTEAQEMAARIAARVQREAPAQTQRVSTGQDQPPTVPAAEQSAPVAQDVPAAPQEPAAEAPPAPVEAPVAAAPAESETAAPVAAETVSDDAAPGQAPSVDGAGVEAGVEAGQASPGRRDGRLAELRAVAEQADRDATAASTRYIEATNDFRAGQMDDATFLGIRRERDEAIRRWEEATAALQEAEAAVVSAPTVEVDDSQPNLPGVVAEDPPIPAPSVAAEPVTPTPPPADPSAPVSATARGLDMAKKYADERAAEDVRENQARPISEVKGGTAAALAKWVPAGKGAYTGKNFVGHGQMIVVPGALPKFEQAVAKGGLQAPDHIDAGAKRILDTAKKNRRNVEWQFLEQGQYPGKRRGEREWRPKAVMGKVEGLDQWVGVNPMVYDFAQKNGLQIQVAGERETDGAYAQLALVKNGEVVGSVAAMSPGPAAEMASMQQTLAERSKPAPRATPNADALVDEAQYDPLDAFVGTMPNHQPLWRSIGTPPRPASDTITVAGETIKLPPLHKPIMRERIRLLAEQIMGRRVYANKVKGKTVAGYYSRDTGSIRLKRFDDLEVLAHEMAHWLDFNSTQDGAFNKWRKGLPKNLRDELGSFSYTSDPGKVQSEGFAEFMRLWLTRYDALESTAPRLLANFNAFLDTQPGIKKQLGKLRSEMHAYYYQGALAQARGNIGADDSVVTATRRFVNRRPSDLFRQQAVDRLHGIKIAERETTGDLNQGARSAYKLMQLANGAGSVYDAVIHEGTLQLAADGSFEVRGKGLAEIFKPIYKQGALAFDDFLVYATGRRAQELMAQGRENLFTPQQIAAALKLERPGFAKVFEEFQTFNAEMLDFYVQMGLITPDQRAAFQEANQNYVPFHRVAERLESGKGGGDQIGKRLKGGDRNLRDIADNIVNGLHTNIRAAMVARAKAQLYRTLTSNDVGGTFAVPLATDSKKVRVALDDMAKKVAEAMAEVGLGVSRNGLIVANPDAETMTDVADIKDVLAERTDLLELWQHHQPPQTKDTFVDSVIIDGERKYFEVTDPVLIESLMGHQVRDQWLVTRALIAARRFISASITVMPPFFLPNAVRDTVNAATMSDSGFRPVIDTMRGMKAIVTRAPVYKEWLRNGGGYSSLVQNTTTGAGRAGLALPARNAWDYAGKALAGLETVASLFENGSRMGEYMRAIEKGASKVEATWRAREISTDFSQQPGSYGWATLLQTIPFANAALQGNDRLMRAFLGNKEGLFNKPTAHAFLVRATNKWMVSIAVFTAALWAINEDDERYQKLTPDEKSRFWHIWLPGAERAIRIPKPYGVGFIGADLTENTLDYVKRREGADTARNLAWAFPHHFWFMDYPGLLSPFIEDMKNETFTGAPIVPYYMQTASPPYQFTESTPEIYKRLGESLNISPMRTQHYARGFFGYMETALSQTTEMMLWDKEAFGERPFPQGIDDYALRQFRSSPYPYRTKYTEGYYRLRQRARTAAMDLSLAKRNATRRPDTLENLSKDELAMFLAGLDKRFRQIDRGLSDMRDAITGIKYDPNLSREEKETQIEALYRDRDRLLTRTYADLEAAVRTVEGK